MMCSDLISFHNYEPAKCFFTATSRMLDSVTAFKKGGKIAVQSHGREVKIRISHIAVDLKDIHRTMASPEFLQAKKHLSSTLSEIRGKYILCSIDRAHPISGMR